ncbi:alpha-2-macroglobulin family protein [Histidinibacterium lentulum]|uniref:Alpha-2-macroglobulin family protein n=1 Tax=Histidinibacterium lentulum TaxID=2480588 RepID=A0A3N2R174_9RHOB|nr:alpha-2-macroglobulin family protein [Histidinibacterium lentulum]ROU01222.1 alpha-2-macroglobulin family protein [Histidinibacterium lentulum]
MIRSILIVLLSILPVHVTAQTDPVPDRRVAISRNVDFFGADLASIFDTTLDACQAACFANPECTAFTYNQRNGSCFPKAGVSEVTFYDGAVSGRLYETEPAVLSGAGEKAARLEFLREGDLAAARELGRTLGRLHSTDETDPGQYVALAEMRRQEGALYDALRFTGAALAPTDAADLWIDYADLALAAPIGDADERRRVRARALPAAVNGYLRAESAAQEHTVLAVMAEALEQDGRGRQMIDALRLAQEAQFRRDTELRLEEAIGRHGFRVTGTDAESDSAMPRICAEFSEVLVQAGVDYGTYVQLPDQSLTVEAEGAQLCIDGVAHGERYRVVLREGLPAGSGEVLIRPVELTMYVRDRSPGVRFEGRGYVLPRTPDAGLPLTSVNVGEVGLALYRVPDRNLVRTMQEGFFPGPVYDWQEGYVADQLGLPLWEGTAEVRQELNRDVTTRLPMADALEGEAPGLFLLQARVPGRDDEQAAVATQWFVLTDLGLATMAGTDGLTVSVRALGDAGAAEGAAVSLVSEGNAVLGEAVTGEDGIARFDAGLTRGTGAAAPALVLAERDGDMAFLSLRGPAFDLSDRGVEGRAPSPPIDVFVATDRGAYRAGETIHVTALMRDPGTVAVEGVPLTAILTRPDGVEYSRHVSVDDVAGGHVFALPVAPSAPRGVWSVALHADVDDAPLAQQSVLVEDFLPERIDVELTLAETLRLGDVPPLEVRADYLFGAPAAGLDVEGEVVLRSAAALEGFPGYRFGRHDQPFSARAQGLGDGWVTDASGAVTVDLPIPEADAGGRPLSLQVIARVQELSGRPVERRAEAQVLPDGPMLGIRPAFGEDVLGEGATAEFSVLALGPDLEPVEMRAEWTVNRVTTEYQWYSVNGAWNWEPVTRRERIAAGEIAPGAAPAQIAVPVDWGQYELIVERLGGEYLAASTEFHAGWYAPADSSDTPDTLEVSLDAESYAVGDTAELRVVPRYDGTALVSVMSDRVISMQAVEVSEGESIIPLEVTGEWAPGAYVTVSVIRPMDAEQERNPARALGLVHAAVDPGDKRLSVAVEAPDTAMPREPLEVAVAVKGAAPGETAHVTLAAVDAGILNLTGYESPDPSGHYFGQRRLGVEMRDVYGRLLDGMTGEIGQLRFGGDGGMARRMQSPPPTEELVAYFEGPVTVGADGRARAVFDMPSFNGTVKVMAVAWTRSGVGQAEAEVLVRDPVVVNVTVPRFMAPGDESRMLIEVTHAYGPTGAVELRAEAQGIELPVQEASGEVGERTGFVTRLPLRAGAAGLAEITLTAVTPDGRELRKDLSVPVEMNDPEVARTSRFTLASGGTFTFDDDAFAGFRDGTGTATLSVGPLARFDAPGLLAMLDRYPYGCTEQVTSQALPLLYFDQVASAMGLAEAEETRERIAGAIGAILANQARNGAFGLWGAYSGDLWLDAYVTDFLSKAKARGHDVPEVAFGMALDNLRNRVNYYPDFDQGGADLAYALLVLAREGAAAIGDLRYYADEKAEAFGTPLAKAQLGAALAQYGEQRRADAMFARASAELTERLASEETMGWREDYGTDRRDAAAVLTLAVEAGSAAVDTGRLTDAVAQGGRASTQEAAWTLMAAHALIDDLRDTGVSVDGAAPEGPLVFLREDSVAAAPVRFGNTGAETELTVTAFGVPEVPPEAGGNGYAIDRSWFTMEGEPANPDGVAVGTRLVTVLTVTPFGRQEARLMVDDPLPAGFEIDNPNLLRSGDMSGLDWLETVEPQTAEFRQERFLAAVDHLSDAPFRLAYVVRAVSPGAFHLPAASVEDMYRPEMRANTAAGRVTIVE